MPGFCEGLSSFQAFPALCPQVRLKTLAIIGQSCLGARRRCSSPRSLPQRRSKELERSEGQFELPLGATGVLEPASMWQVPSKGSARGYFYATGVRKDVQQICLEKLCSVTLHSLTLHSAALHTMHGHARSHTGI